MYEYKVIKTGFANAEEEVNALAKQGYRVVEVSPNIAVGHGFFVFLEKEKDTAF